jgi:phosphatidyl-myo-inositol dimannoside synthase
MSPSDLPSPGPGRRLLLSEWFPPDVGGSAELFANIYSRLPGTTDVITSVRPSAGERTWPSLRVHRVRFDARLGVLDPGSLASHVRLSRLARRTMAGRGVIHCGRALPEGTIAVLAQWPRVRAVCWTHGEELPIVASSRELAWLLRRVHRRAAALVANSRNSARLLVELGNAPEKVHVVHPGVDATRFTPNARDELLRQRLLRGRDVLLLSVGRLQARKGHDLVLRALARLGPDGPRVRYVVVGRGPEAERLRQLARELGVDDRIEWVDELADADLPAWYASADLFVHPNRVEGTDFEGFGIVFLEAAASGLVAIGGRSGGVPEAIEDGRTGLLVSGNDAEELARAIARLAGDAAARRLMGEAGRARAVQDFSWERAARRVAEIEAATFAFQ